MVVNTRTTLDYMQWTNHEWKMHDSFLSRDSGRVWDMLFQAKWLNTRNMCISLHCQRKNVWKNATWRRRLEFSRMLLHASQSFSKFLDVQLYTVADFQLSACFAAIVERARMRYCKQYCVHLYIQCFKIKDETNYRPLAWHSIASFTLTTCDNCDNNL